MGARTTGGHTSSAPSVSGDATGAGGAETGSEDTAADGTEASGATVRWVNADAGKRSSPAPDLRAVACAYVDVMNVVGSRPDGWWHDPDAAVRRLVARLPVLAVGTGARIVAVVDGLGIPELPEGEHAGVEVRYAHRKGPDGADDRLVELVAASPPTPEAPAVVATADAALRARVVELGAEVLGPRHLRDLVDACLAARDQVEAGQPPELAVTVVGAVGWRQVRALRLAALADTPDAFAATLAEESRQPATWWRARLEEPDVDTLVVELDTPVGQPVGAGLCVLAPSTDRPGTLGLFSVWVAPWARGTGAGDALLLAVIERARGRGAQELALDVGDHNAAAAGLYLRHGFVPSGRRTTLPPPRTYLTEHELVRDLRGATR
jgi:ribosomal protein S18 acetylase RimI-like enzyme